MNIARTKQRWRHIVYIVFCAGMTIQVVYSLAFGNVKQRDHGTYRSRRLFQVDESINENENDYHPPEDIGISVQLDFLSNWGFPIDHNSSKCQGPSISEFPPDLFTEEQDRQGAIIVHLAVATYMCIALAIVCDYYFVPSLEVICFHLNIQEDVGGATFMCIGSSAPDICAAIVGILLTDGDVGIGTIIGASVFNLLFVIGFCGVLVYNDMKLTWWPFTRDVLWYIISITILTLVIFDSTVQWQEATIMIISYFIYCIMLWQNKRIEKKVYLLVGDIESYQARFEDLVMKISLKDNEDIDDEEVSDTSEDYDYCGYPQDPPENFFECPTTNGIQILSWIVVLPIKIVFFLTIPDLHRPRCQKFVSVTFILGIAWISALTYVLLWMVTIIGETMDIPESVMGITFVAFGTSVPDWFCGVLVAQRGKHDMAIAQAVAGNTLGILIGLGVPWLIKTLMHENVKIDSIGMLISCFETLIIAVVILLVFYWRKFVLGKKLGWSLLVVYTIYMISSVVLEVQLYAAFRLPLCSTLQKNA